MKTYFLKFSTRRLQFRSSSNSPLHGQLCLHRTLPIQGSSSAWRRSGVASRDAVFFVEIVWIKRRSLVSPMSVWKKCQSTFFFCFFLKGLLALVSLSGNAFTHFQPLSIILTVFSHLSRFQLFWAVFSSFQPISTVILKLFSTVFKMFQLFFTQF